ncbi:methyl-accepting chemotaxis protein [Ferrimonas lipolytica]|uniref:Methyl-accepting chemotaxis protein n=1 Tax=Ferrimonas lipolytica TaxID=2724191 RepID=A0A6H1UAC4_9GAMM|nr:methyl-accepting chemotaxis protein [Ferrimonas lipolytica]QIZ76007.1 methyl-accepting chemotaxis protein [Ferrimonas lipolytica]
MNLLKRLSIGNKIAIIIGVAVVSCVLLLALFSVHSTRNLERLELLQKSLYPSMQQLQSMSIKTDRIVDSLRTAVMVGETDMLESANEFRQQWLKSAQKLAAVQPIATQNPQLERLMQSYYSQAYALAKGMLDGTLDFQQMEAQAGKINNELEALQQFQTEMISSAQQAVDFAVQETNDGSSEAQFLAAALGLITIIMVLFIGWSVTRNITSGINSVTDSLKEIASGEADLTVRLKYDGKDELGELVSYFNQFVDTLQVLISQTKDNTLKLGEMATRLGQVSTVTNNNIASQSHAIEQTTGALSEMFASVKHISEHAAMASSAATQASTDCDEGRTLMRASVETINELAHDVKHTADEIGRLESHTNNVGSILDTIRSIAEQTNLLALNAAIEAARAGEHGRGFAVVADEVRNLASRTQISTQEIQVVLEELQSASKTAVAAMSRGSDRTETSVAQAENTGVSLNNISDQVSEISQTNHLIAAATEEQSATSEQIRNYIEEIQTMARQSTENTAELEDVSQSLLEINQQLVNEVNHFKV